MAYQAYLEIEKVHVAVVPQGLLIPEEAAVAGKFGGGSAGWRAVMDRHGSVVAVMVSHHCEYLAGHRERGECRDIDQGCVVEEDAEH